jgi:UDP-N-acetylglucosamine--N-acetylmuramyl-(pentapeptide) pyrophosphoryl-undecaprenol N-acetylglucosamine transferase
MKKKILVAAGGTGGHIFPSLTLAKQLVDAYPQTQILFAGKGLSKNPYFKDFSFQDISSSTLSLKNPWRLIKGAVGISKGFYQAKRVIQNFSPDLVLGFGSYYTLPVLLAAKNEGIPFMLHEQNTMPGRVNRLLCRYAIHTAIQFPEAASRLKGKSSLVQMLLRKNGEEATKQEALSYFGFEPRRKTVLVMGGSQGARAINELFSKAAPHSGDIQVIHLTGKGAHLFAKHYRDKGIDCCVKDFETRMDLAYKAADLVVARAGAGTVSELIHYQTPAILIPYPYAMDNHQEVNANAIVSAGGGVKLTEVQASPCVLAAIIKSIFDRGKDQEMEAALRKRKDFQVPSMVQLIGEHLNEK